MRYYAVVDTNVIISAVITKNAESATVKVYQAMRNGKIVPLYHSEILEEYEDVLSRPQFHQSKEAIENFLNAVKQFGIEVSPNQTDEELPDEDDVIFYEVVMEKQDLNAYLITGNIKHFPRRRFVVTPAEMVEIMEREKFTAD